MIVLHALWSSPDGLRLWGEDLRRADAGRRKPSAPGKGRRRKAPRHPFAGRPDTLAEALGPDAPDPVEVTVLLPTTGRPHPSTELRRRGARAPGGRRGLRPWRVHALSFAPAEAPDVILALEESGSPAGDSVRFCARAVRLGLELAAAGRLFPVLVPIDGRYEARWAPVPRPGDEARLRALEASMPRALGPEQTGSSLDPQPLVRDLLDGVVDAVARSALAEHRLCPPRRGRPPRHIPAAESFIDAVRADPSVDGDPEELAELARGLDEWRRSDLRPAEGVRTCFRLTPPSAEGPTEEAEASLTADEDAWELELLLQSAADPSLLVPAAEVWRAGDDLAVLDRRLEGPQERLLADGEPGIRRRAAPAPPAGSRPAAAAAPSPRRGGRGASWRFSRTWAWGAGSRGAAATPAPARCSRSGWIRGRSPRRCRDHGPSPIG